LVFPKPGKGVDGFAVFPHFHIKDGLSVLDLIG